MNKKYRVLMVHNYYQIPGGEDTVVANEKRLLEEHGHTVILYTRNNTELKELSLLGKMLLPVTTLFNPKTYKEVKKIIKENHIDLVHVHNTLNLVSPAVYYAAFSCNVPVVQTVHNFRLLCPGATFYRDGQVCEDCVSKGLRCAILHRCYRNSLLQTAGCVASIWVHRILGTYKKLNYICLTDFNKKKLLTMKGVDRNRIFVKPNFTFEDVTVTAVEGKRRSYFIYVGRLDELKGIKLLFEAWKYLGESAPELMVCGTGPLEDWCKRFLEDNPFCCIQMKGFVPNEEAKRWISKAKALILPTQWYEGFPMTVLEAYSAGTPVVGPDMGNVGCLIFEGITGWKFTSGSMKELVEAIRKAEKAELVVGRELVKQYSAENNYLQLKEIYEKLIDIC